MQLGRVGHRFDERVVATHQAVPLEQGIAPLPGLVAQIVVVAQVSDSPHARELDMPAQHSFGVRASEVRVGDDSVRNAEPVGEGLEPSCLVDRIRGADRRLHVDDLRDVCESRLADEVVRPVALRLDRVVVPEIRVFVGLG